MRNLDSSFYSDEDVGREFLEKYVIIHLNNNYQKVELLSFMSKKLKLLNDDKLNPDNLDSLTMQEILSAG